MYLFALDLELPVLRWRFGAHFVSTTLIRHAFYSFQHSPATCTGLAKAECCWHVSWSIWRQMERKRWNHLENLSWKTLTEWVPGRPKMERCISFETASGKSDTSNGVLCKTTKRHAGQAAANCFKAIHLCKKSGRYNKCKHAPYWSWALRFRSMWASQPLQLISPPPSVIQIMDPPAWLMASFILLLRITSLAVRSSFFIFETRIISSRIFYSSKEQLSRLSPGDYVIICAEKMGPVL